MIPILPITEPSIQRSEAQHTTEQYMVLRSSTYSARRRPEAPGGARRRPVAPGGARRFQGACKCGSRPEAPGGARRFFSTMASEKKCIVVDFYAVIHQAILLNFFSSQPPGGARRRPEAPGSPKSGGTAGAWVGGTASGHSKKILYGGAGTGIFFGSQRKSPFPGRKFLGVDPPGGSAWGQALRG